MKEKGLLFSELLELNYKEYIKFKDVFSERIRYTQEEIDKLTGKVFIGERDKVLKNKAKIKDLINYLNIEMEQKEARRNVLIHKCAKLCKEKNFDRNYFDLMVFEEVQLIEIYEYLETI